MPLPICRRCRSPITGEHSTITATDGPLFGRLRHAPLCADCCGALLDWLRQAELFEALNETAAPAHQITAGEMTAARL